MAVARGECVDGYINNIITYISTHTEPILTVTRNHDSLYELDIPHVSEHHTTPVVFQHTNTLELTPTSPFILLGPVT